MAYRLPPLNALRTFEAAGRHLSFTKAADELHVTQAAVSHQIKSLESWLEAPLFRRLNRALLLTETGQRYLIAIRDALDQIDSATRQVVSVRPDNLLTISVIPVLWREMAGVAPGPFCASPSGNRGPFYGRGPERRFRARGCRQRYSLQPRQRATGAARHATDGTGGLPHMQPETYRGRTASPAPAGRPEIPHAAARGREGLRLGHVAARGRGRRR